MIIQFHVVFIVMSCLCVRRRKPRYISNGQYLLANTMDNNNKKQQWFSSRRHHRNFHHRHHHHQKIMLMMTMKNANYGNKKKKYSNYLDIWINVCCCVNIFTAATNHNHNHHHDGHWNFHDFIIIISIVSDIIIDSIYVCVCVCPCSFVLLSNSFYSSFFSYKFGSNILFLLRFLSKK